MLLGFHGLELVIVLIIACLIFGRSKFLAISLKVSLEILHLLAILIFGPRLTIRTFREVLKDFLKYLERLEQEKFTIPTFREVLRDFLKRWKRRL